MSDLTKSNMIDMAIALLEHSDRNHTAELSFRSLQVADKEKIHIDFDGEVSQGSHDALIPDTFPPRFKIIHDGTRYCLNIKLEWEGLP